MSDNYFNVLNTSGIEAGTSWSTGKPFRFLQAIYAASTIGSRFFIGGDPQKEFAYFLNAMELNLNRAGTEIAPFELYFGGFGNRISTAPEQGAPIFVGDRPTPFIRGNSQGANFISLLASYHKLIGLNAEALNCAIIQDGALTGITVADVLVKNAAYAYGATAESSLTNAVFENIHGENLSNGLIYIPKDSSNVRISGFSCQNRSAEDGEFRGINVRENNTSISIEDGVINGAVDMYVGGDPTETGSYNQGDGISIEDGVGAQIKRMLINDCTDRGIDCKAQVDIDDSHITSAKIGISTWKDGSLVRNCSVKTPRGNSNNLGVCFQAQGQTNYYNNSARIGNNYCRGVFDLQESCEIVGGNYFLDPSYQYFIRSLSKNIKVRLVDAWINGVKYNETVSISGTHTVVP